VAEEAPQDQRALLRILRRKVPPAHSLLRMRRIRSPAWRRSERRIFDRFDSPGHTLSNASIRPPWSSRRALRLIADNPFGPLLAREARGHHQAKVSATIGLRVQSRPVSWISLCVAISCDSTQALLPAFVRIPRSSRRLVKQ
jgi:hypothetical protein